MANPNFSSSRPLLSPIQVDSSASGVKCNGGNAALGHPEVYYSFDGENEVICGYCGQEFIKKS